MVGEGPGLPLPRGGRASVCPDSCPGGAGYLSGTWDGWGEGPAGLSNLG